MEVLFHLLHAASSHATTLDALEQNSESTKIWKVSAHSKLWTRCLKEITGSFGKCFRGEFSKYNILESFGTQQTVDQIFKRDNWRFWKMLLSRIQKVQHFGKFWHTVNCGPDV